LDFLSKKSASLGARNSLIHLPSGGMAPLPFLIWLFFCSDVCGLVMSEVIFPLGSQLPMVLSPCLVLLPGLLLPQWLHAWYFASCSAFLPLTVDETLYFRIDSSGGKRRKGVIDGRLNQ